MSFLENHDQVANTGPGERLFHQAGRAEWRAITALLLLGPALPLLFQGQEFGSSRPFAYFADHEGDLATAVAKGRLEFLAQFPNLKSAAMHLRIPPPAAFDTFLQCKLVDSERDADSPTVRLHRDLLALRAQDPVLSALGSDAVRIETSALSADIVVVRYLGAPAQRLLVVNLGDDSHSPMNDPLLSPPAARQWKELWSSERPQYGGSGVIPLLEAGAWLITGRSATLLGDSA